MASLSLYLLTFNCGRTLIQPEIFAPYIFDALPADHDPDFVSINLQEIAPIGPSFLGGSFLTPYFDAFRHAVKLAKPGYVNVISRNVGLTAIMLFVKDDVAPNISGLHTAGVGLGLYDMGNKGAVGIRLGYGDMELCFVSAHLAAMEDALQRRNEDYEGIVRRLVFVPELKLPIRDESSEDAPLLQGLPPASSEVGIYHAGCHLFFAGDLNYRTSISPPSDEDVKTFPQPRNDPKDPKHYSHLLASDQLRQQVEAHKTLHGLNEAPIKFLPTYKYNSDKPVALDGDDNCNWATHRWPSWCDRVFYSSTNITSHSYKSLPLFGTSDHRPVALAVTVPLGPVTNQEISAPFPIDPDWKSRRDAGRRKEFVVGVMAYLTLTWEGNALLLSSTVGAWGGWLIMRLIIMA